jgi:Family of unknown function (DUF6650)
MVIRLTGISLPWLGISFEIKPGDADVALRVLGFLEDRRVLFGDRHDEDLQQCLVSAQEIRRYLSQEINATKKDSNLREILRAMRAAARRFVDSAGPNGHEWFGPRRPFATDPFSLALGDFRALVGVQVALLAKRYDLEVDDGLASILPPTPRPRD